MRNKSSACLGEMRAIRTRTMSPRPRRPRRTDSALSRRAPGARMARRRPDQTVPKTSGTIARAATQVTFSKPRPKNACLSGPHAIPHQTIKRRLRYKPLKTVSALSKSARAPPQAKLPPEAPTVQSTAIQNAQSVTTASTKTERALASRIYARATAALPQRVRNAPKIVPKNARLVTQTAIDGFLIKHASAVPRVRTVSVR
jgi:hypothetical protein